jgi:hypothetical protein
MDALPDSFRVDAIRGKSSSFEVPQGRQIKRKRAH